MRRLDRRAAPVLSRLLAILARGSSRPARRPHVPPAEELVIPVNERKYIQTLTESCCRWPIGDPQQPEFHFCGKTKIPGLPYCEVHARRAFQPPQARRRDRDFTPMIALPTVVTSSPEPQAPEQPSEKAAV